MRLSTDLGIGFRLTRQHVDPLPTPPPPPLPPVLPDGYARQQAFGLLVASYPLKLLYSDRARPILRRSGGATPLPGGETYAHLQAFDGGPSSSSFVHREAFGGS